MTIHDIKDKDGRVTAFQVSTMFLGRRGVCRIVRSIPGVRILKEPQCFGEEKFCMFEVDGQKFVAWEPFGDNSRYWIGPEPPQWCAQLNAVRETFVQA